MFSPEFDVARRVEAELATRVDGRDALSDALAAFLLRGGGRMRARFVWWGWVAGGGDTGPVGSRTPVLLGTALELLQACALIHDDVMDGSRTRRGGPALHEQFADVHRRSGWAGDAAAYGVAQAVLAGDLALVMAEDLLRDIPFAGGPATRRRVELVWQAMRREMVEGQHLDLRLQAERSDSPEDALKAAELKAALYSVARPLELGASAAGADAEATGVLRAFGRRVGLAFQLRDDLLGVYGDSAVTGKPSGDDVRSGKRTYMVTVALEAARARGDARAESVLCRALGDPGLGEEGLEEFRDLLWSLSAVHAVQERIALLVEEAVGLLRRGRFGPDCVAALEELARQAAGERWGGAVSR